MLSYIERLREKPEHIRRRYVWIFSFGIILIILFVWVTSFSYRLEKLRNAEAAKSKTTEAIESTLQIKENKPAVSAVSNSTTTPEESPSSGIIITDPSE